MTLIADLNLTGKRVLVVGGGRAAEPHLENLQGTGALNILLATELTTGVARLVELGEIAWERRELGDGDIESAWLVLALTDDTALNSGICRTADQRGKLTYGDGDGYRGNIALPTVLRRGGLALAVETGMPHLSRQIVHELEEDYGPEWTDYTQALDVVRTRIQVEVSDELERQRLIHRITSPAVMALVRAGETVEWQTVLGSVLAHHPASAEAVGSE